MPRIRLDEWLVSKGYFADLVSAQRAIRAGKVENAKSGESLDKVGMSVPKSLAVRIARGSAYVSRGGDKLESFLNDSQLNVKDLVALDVGSSTGGFTDCLLQRGAKKVYCIDVGRHQLHERIRSDERVSFFEEIDIRHFDLMRLIPRPDLVVVDVAFISLKAIVPYLLNALPNARMILLFKPQFEVDRYSPKKRGVADVEEAAKSLEEMLQFLRGLGLNILMHRPSALKGLKGNQETFIMVEKGSSMPIFRTYDIRGLADRDLPNERVYQIGRAFGERLKSKRPRGAVGVGRDERLSSPRIFHALARGLSDAGVQVIELGLTTTPQVYFAHFNFDLDAVIQVTASHNPKDDNGMKMMMLRDTLFGDEIRSLGLESEKVKAPANLNGAPSELGESKAQPLQEAYGNFIHEHFKFSKKFNIALDCGNGMVGLVARSIFSRHCSKLEILFEEVDCRFPHHEADPTVPENLKALQKLLATTEFDMGFAFDGDGDRLGVVTKRGRILWGDEILMLLSELVLRDRPGSTVIGEVKCSEKLFRMIEDRGGKGLMYKTGHSLIKKKMKELGAPLAGEMSGHLFFADRYFGFDDAVYAAFRVMEVVDRLNLDLDDWISQFPESFVTPEIRVSCDEAEKEGLVSRASEFLQKIDGARVTLIDGIRVGFSDGAWALVRASNTQAVLVVRVEAPSKNRQREVLGLVEKALGRSVNV